MMKRGARVQITLSVWNGTQPLFLKEMARGGAVRNILCLIENPKDVAVRLHVFLKENALPQLPCVFDRKYGSGAAPCIRDRNTKSMQLRPTKLMQFPRSVGRITENALTAV